MKKMKTAGALLDLNLDWRRWFKHWETMQGCYIPERINRFGLMLEFPEISKNAKLNIMDLGCGPGSLAFCALKHFPHAQALAIDADPLLLAMGRKAAGRLAPRIRFLQTDLCRPDWCESYGEKFDLVLSATALHWLSAKNLTNTYKRVFQVMKPGGWFLNSDHIADDDPTIQDRFRKILQTRQEHNFAQTRADDWDGFWKSLENAMGKSVFQKIRGQKATWQGTDDGQPCKFHFTALKRCGFSKVDLIWRDLGEAIIAAQK